MSERVTLEIVGLSCGGGGVLTIERALARLAGVRRVYVNPATEMAYVEYDAGAISPTQLVGVVKELGFGASELVRH